MNQKRHRLDVLDLDEVSLVSSGDDPMALHVLSKSADVTKNATCGYDSDGKSLCSAKKGKMCPTCGNVVKTSPEGGDMNVAAPVVVMDFRHAGTMRRKRKTKKWVKPYKRGDKMIAGYFTASKGHARDGDGDGFVSGPDGKDNIPVGGRSGRKMMARSRLKGTSPIARRRAVQAVSTRGRSSNLSALSRSDTMTPRSKARAASRMKRKGDGSLSDIKYKYGLEGAPRPHQSKRGDEHLNKARDGDGDGFVHDGTPRQRPVSPADRRAANNYFRQRQRPTVTRRTGAKYKKEGRNLVGARLAQSREYTAATKAGFGPANINITGTGSSGRDTYKNDVVKFGMYRSKWRVRHNGLDGWDDNGKPIWLGSFSDFDAALKFASKQKKK